MYKALVTFDGKSYSLTDYIKPYGVEIDAQLCNAEGKSCINTATIQLLPYPALIQAMLVAEDRYANIEVMEYGELVFKGVLRIEVALRYVDGLAQDITLDCFDISYRLDEPIEDEESMFVYPNAPTSKKGLEDIVKGKTGGSLGSFLESVLKYAGYTEDEWVAPDLVDSKVQFVSYLGVTPREILDTVLSERGYVLDALPDGRLTIKRWAKLAGRDTDISDVIHPDIELERNDLEHDGVELTFNTIAYSPDVRLWEAQMPTLDGSYVHSGDYYPDKPDVWQEYQGKWIKKANPKSWDDEFGVDLLYSTNHYHLYNGFQAPVEFKPEPLRAKISVYNSTGDAQYIQGLNIRGAAAYRYEEHVIKFPDTAKRPKKLTARWIFDEEEAIKFAKRGFTGLERGAVTASFTSIKFFEVGEPVAFETEGGEVFRGLVFRCQSSRGEGGIYVYRYQALSLALVEVDGRVATRKVQTIKVGAIEPPPTPPIAIVPSQLIFRTDGRGGISPYPANIEVWGGADTKDYKWKTSSDNLKVAKSIDDRSFQLTCKHKGGMSTGWIECTDVDGGVARASIEVIVMPKLPPTYRKFDHIPKKNEAQEGDYFLLTKDVGRYKSGNVYRITGIQGNGFQLEEDKNPSHLIEAIKDVEKLPDKAKEGVNGYKFLVDFITKSAVIKKLFAQTIEFGGKITGTQGSSKMVISPTNIVNSGRFGSTNIYEGAIRIGDEGGDNVLLHSQHIQVKDTWIDNAQPKFNGIKPWGDILRGVTESPDLFVGFDDQKPFENWVIKEVAGAGHRFISVAPNGTITLGENKQAKLSLPRGVSLPHGAKIDSNGTIELVSPEGAHLVGNSDGMYITSPQSIGNVGLKVCEGYTSLRAGKGKEWYYVEVTSDGKVYIKAKGGSIKGVKVYGAVAN